MTVSECVSANTRELDRLRRVAESLSKADLETRLENGKTVASVLVHLAFWDDYIAAMLRQWEQTGFAPARSNYDAFNEAIAHLASAVPAQEAPTLAITAATAVDRQVETLSDTLAAAILDVGAERLLMRAAHRGQHVDQIERTVRSGHGTV